MWYPTILSNVNVNIDRAGIVANYGEQSKDACVLNVRYQNVNGQKVVDGKPYLLPKEWDRQPNDSLSSTITFTDGEKFDFFFVGEYDSTEPIKDDDFMDGFFNYMNDNFDHVFAITSVSEFEVIPHFEITGK